VAAVEAKYSLSATPQAAVEGGTGTCYPWSIAA
jgi:hypothetical protein